MKRLIIIEGVDCSGKSTLSNKLWCELRRRNNSFVINDYHEPFLNLPHATNNNAKILLQTAQRVELYSHIQTLTDLVDYIIVDRSFVSTTIYQDIDMHGIWNLTTQYVDEELFKNALWIVLTPSENQLAQNMINRAIAGKLDQDERNLHRLVSLNNQYKSVRAVLRNFVPKQNIKVYEEINDEVINELLEELIEGEDNE